MAIEQGLEGLWGKHEVGFPATAKPVLLTKGYILLPPQRDIGQCLETFWIVTSGRDCGGKKVVLGI